VLLALALLPAAARAQGADARTLRRGWLEFRAAGIYQQFDSRFGPGGSEPLSAAFQAELTPLADSLLAPVVGPVRTGLAAFFAGTAGRVSSPVTPAEVSGGSLRAELASDVRRAPVSLAYGLTRRITVAVTVPFERNGTAVSALGLTGSSLGLNTQPDANAGVLAKIDSSYATLGRSALLPISGTPAAVELQRRVKALGTDSLLLPTTAFGVAALLGLPTSTGLLTQEDTAALRASSAATLYYLGDVEASVRFQFLNTTGAPAYALARPGGARAALTVTGRFPTGPKADTAFLLVLPRETGHFGVAADLTGDVFMSGRFWLTGSAGFAQLFGTDVLRRQFSATRPFPGDTAPQVTLRREPGSRISAMLLPRYRLTREITFAAGYRLDHQGATSYGSGDGAEVVLGPLERTEAWTAHSLSLGTSYSTIEAFEAGRARVPFEVSLLYHNSLAGSGYAPHAGTLEVVGRFLYQAVGRPRRARADTTTADSAAVLPPPPPPARSVTPAGEPTTSAPAERPRPAAPPTTAPAAPPATPNPTPATQPNTPTRPSITPPNERPPATPPPPPASPSTGSSRG